MLPPPALSTWPRKYSSNGVAQPNGDLRLSGFGLDDRAALGPREVNVPIPLSGALLHSVSSGASGERLEVLTQPVHQLGSFDSARSKIEDEALLIL